MILKYQHDFSDDPDYQLPYVLVYKGGEAELMDVGLFCHTNLSGRDLWTTGPMYQLDEHHYSQSFHFIRKSDAMLVKLRHDV